MWKRPRTWVFLFALFGIALAVYFEPTLCVRGWLHGEAFFDGRPTSYWRGVIECELATPNAELLEPPPPIWSATWCERFGIRTRRDRSYWMIMHSDAAPVLDELSRDDSPRIRLFAQEVNDYKINELPRIAAMQPPFRMDITVHTPWIVALQNARNARDAE